MAGVAMASVTVVSLLSSTVRRLGFVPAYQLPSPIGEGADASDAPSRAGDAARIPA